MDAEEMLTTQWRSIRSAIDEAIERTLRRLPEAEAVEAARYIAMGGKRLRGFILLELAQALGAKLEDAIDAAVAVELVHAASLALDDIIDEDLTRRGNEAAWIRYGLKKTVMVSNLLIPFAQTIVYKRYGKLALERTVEAWLNISRGEVIDAFVPLEKLAPNSYLEMVRLKTGALFKLSAELGVLAAGRSDLLKKAGELGEKLGIMYQIADDIRDSSDPDKLKKEPSLRLFKMWAPSPDQAHRKIRELLEETMRLMRELVSAGHTVLELIPGFVIKAMLGRLP